MIVYGSRAKGNYRRGSDIDLTIKDRLLDFSELMQILDRIDDLFIPSTVDVSQYATLNNADLIEHINRVGVVIYDSNAKTGSLSVKISVTGALDRSMMKPGRRKWPAGIKQIETSMIG